MTSFGAFSVVKRTSLKMCFGVTVTSPAYLPQVGSVAVLTLQKTVQAILTATFTLMASLTVEVSSSRVDI